MKITKRQKLGSIRRRVHQQFANLLMDTLYEYTKRQIGENRMTMRDDHGTEVLVMVPGKGTPAYEVTVHVDAVAIMRNKGSVARGTNKMTELDYIEYKDYYTVIKLALEVLKEIGNDSGVRLT